MMENRMIVSKSPKKQQRQIQQLRRLVGQLLLESSYGDESKAVLFQRQKNINLQLKLRQTEKINIQLNNIVIEQKKTNQRLQKDLQIQKNNNLKFQNALGEAKQQAMEAKREVKTREIRQIQILSPNSESYAMNSYKTPINKLWDIKDSHPIQSNNDHIYRLNSYIIEYNTNLKLLLQKHSYLLKLRNINLPNQALEIELIQKTSKLLSDRKVIDQANVELKNSRKIYFDSDGSSDIQEQVQKMNK